MSRRRLVVYLAGGVKDQADIHHDVDEYRIVCDKRTQILAFLVVALGEGTGRLQHDLLQSGLARDPVPTVIRGEKDEAVVVNIAVVLTHFRAAGVADRLLHPPFRFRLIRGRVAEKNPHHSRQKTVAPVRPRGSIMFPAARRWCTSDTNPDRFPPGV